MENKATLQKITAQSSDRQASLLATLRRDLVCVLERDPAARSKLEVFLLYPGLHAVWAHRVSN